MKTSAILVGASFIASVAPAAPISIDGAKFADIDRAFVCPESLPSAEAKEASLRQFLNQVAGLGSVTVSQMIDLRMQLLTKHGCTKTLQKIHENAGKNR